MLPLVNVPTVIIFFSILFADWITTKPAIPFEFLSLPLRYIGISTHSSSVTFSAALWYYLAAYIGGLVYVLGPQAAFNYLSEKLASSWKKTEEAETVKVQTTPKDGGSSSVSVRTFN